MSVVSFYSGAGDGYVSRNSRPTWADAHDTADGTSAQSSSTTSLSVRAYHTDSAHYSIYRGQFPFNTSVGIDEGLLIVGGTLGVTNVTNPQPETNLVLLQGFQADPTTLAIGDFDAFGSVELAARQAYQSGSVGAQTIFTLNDAGLALINRAGWTMFCLRTEADFLNVEPAAAASNGPLIAPHGYATPAYQPTLTLTLAAPSGSVPVELLRTRLIVQGVLQNG